MTTETQPTELQRALARNDVDKLRRELHEAFEFHLWLMNGEDPSVAEIDRGIPIDTWHDRDTRLAICALAMAEFDDPHFLGVLAAGPLEDALVTKYSGNKPVEPEFLDRVIAEAMRTPRFRWMLSGIWTSSAEPNVSEAVRRVVGEASLDDPLPPRPSA